MGFGFAFSSLLIHVLRFYRLKPNKCMLNLFRMVGCIEKFNRQFGLKLTHHDINYIYIYCKVEFNQPSCWLYSVPNLLIIMQLVTLCLGGNHVRVVYERV